MISKKLLKLAKALLQLAQITTDKAVLVYEGELVEGVEVFIEDENGELIAPEDGEYVAEDKVFVIEGGRVIEVREKAEPADPGEPKEPKEPVEPEPDEKDARIAELEAQMAEKDAEIAQKQAELDEKDARIAELEAENDELKARIAEGEAKSAEEELKLKKQPKQSTIVFNQFKQK